MQLEKWQRELVEGKAELKAGEQELAAGKKEYEEAEDNNLLVLMDNWFNSGKGFAEGREQIAEGDRQVAAGENKISEGDKRLDAGGLKLGKGLGKLTLARTVRQACGIAAVFLGVLSIVLGFRWRRSLSRLQVSYPAELLPIPALGLMQGPDGMSSILNNNSATHIFMPSTTEVVANKIIGTGLVRC